MTRPRVAPETPLIDRLRFWAREDEAGCWLWWGYTRNGYASLFYQGAPRYAHRLAYEEFVAEIPAGLQLDHLCRKPACINPWHLDPVTPLINTRRGKGHGSEEACPSGHPYDDANTYRNKGRRYCRTCNVHRRRVAA